MLVPGGGPGRLNWSVYEKHSPGNLTQNPSKRKLNTTDKYKPENTQNNGENRNLKNPLDYLFYCPELTLRQWVLGTIPDFFLQKLQLHMKRKDPTYEIEVFKLDLLGQAKNMEQEVLVTKF